MKLGSSMVFSFLIFSSAAWAARPSDPKAFPRFTDSFAQVDRTRGMGELLRERGQGSFARSIEAGIRSHLQARVPSIGGNDSVFGISGASAPVSLISHPQCSVSGATLAETIGHDPGSKTVALVNEFARRVNEARHQALYSRWSRERLKGWDTVVDLYAKLMGCLAYTESLSTADSQTSYSVARSVSPQGYEKPRGVKFYLDRAQSNPASRLNIGLYQFSPDPRGNVVACVRNWNAVWPRNPLFASMTSSTLIERLGDQTQYFNAFCGVNKLAQIFHVQVNTQSSKRTHPWNRVHSASGRYQGLRPSAERCVSLHFNSKAYNHFGPFQNSTRRNLSEVLSCALR